MPPLEKHCEALKLYSNILKCSDSATAEAIAFRVPLSAEAGPEERRLWINTAMKELSLHFDRQSVWNIRMGCHCETGLTALVRLLRNCRNAASSFSSFGELLQTLSTEYFGDEYLYVKDNYIYRNLYSCPCPMLKGISSLEGPEWCYCTGGYHKAALETAFERPVRVELLQSVMQGADCCRYRFSFDCGDPFTQRAAEC